MHDGTARCVIVHFVFEVIVLDRSGDQGAEVLVQRASHRYVEHLQAAANAENRLAVAQRPADQPHFRPITRGIGPAAARVPLLVIALRIDIDAAGQKNAVQVRVDGFVRRPIAGQQRDDPRHRTERGQRLNVAMLHDPGRRLLGGQGMECFRGNANHRECGTGRDLLKPKLFKKGTGTFAGTALRVLRTKVPVPFLNHAQ